MSKSIFGRFKKEDKPIETQHYPQEDRIFWVKTLQKIAIPVLSNLKNDSLKKNIPDECISSQRIRSPSFEAFARLFCGIAPWLELGPDETSEGKIRENYRDLTLKGLNNLVSSDKEDYVLFHEIKQSLVEAAFLAQGLLRAKNQIWFNLSLETQSKIIKELKGTRKTPPYENNWLLFTSIIEAALLEFTGECDFNRLIYGVNKFKNEWYKGDGLYSDGVNFRFDYYNSLVIHPMLIDILKVMRKYGFDEEDFLELELKRASRYSAELERLISPEGTYPVIGRSISYRTGVFHSLAQSSLMKILPKNIDPAQIRSAFTLIIKKQFEDDQNFDKKGWLSVGFNGKQLDISEDYINTGSLYLCSTIFLPLGLPIDDPFWSKPYSEWTNLKAWNGKPVDADKFIDF
ncbi:DUF2264 domain-containing protein [Methanobrevibacter sp. DSM 116169]|uniref:DUF2264 domain-containing protein n=1 Tax=Methanobrevibacter sp. DSM 116169 TaxID=3242727 RepID=UPI0038FCA988